MKKKIICLLAAVMLMMTAGAMAAAKQQVIPAPWQTIDLGPAEQDIISYDTSTIKYDRNEDGSINKNIILYDERKSNDIPMSTEYRYYSVTKCKLNVQAQAILFGEQSFYTKKDKLRWTDEPTYMTWITVSPGTIGAKRAAAIIDYAKAHDSELAARS